MIPDSLLDSVRAGLVVPFVGSGLSLAVKSGLFPTWPRVLEKLASNLVREARPDDAQLLWIALRRGQMFEAAEAAYSGLGKYRFDQVMREVFGKEKPPDVDLSAPNALWRLRPRLVITTNYDSVLAWSKPESVRVYNHQVAELARLVTDPTVLRPRVWHLHGHVDQLDSLILAPAQYRKLYDGRPGVADLYTAALQRLRSVILDRPLLFVGFGLADRYVMAQLHDVLAAAGNALPPSYALMKEGSVDEERIWREHGVQVVTFADHGRPLVELLCQLGGQAGVTPNASSPSAAAEVVTPVDRFGVVPLPATLVIGRGKDLDRVLDLIGRLSGEPAQKTLVVRGWPGVGKSTFVTALANDPRAAAAFPDGCLWASAGESPDVLGELTAWGRRLMPGVSKFTDLDEAMRLLRASLRDRRMLLVVDDVWTTASAVAFKVGGPSCQTLFTTRSTEVSRELATTHNYIYLLKQLIKKDAFKLLKRNAPTVVAQHPVESRQLDTRRRATAGGRGPTRLGDFGSPRRPPAREAPGGYRAR
jgi:hypothetical protein